MYQINADCQVKDLDKIYTKWFGEDKRDGYYVEVGAFDGIVVSNTLALVQLGWSGLAIEPNPINFANLGRTFSGNPKINCLQFAVGERGIANIYMHYSISTTSKEAAELYKTCDWFSGNEQVIDVQMFPLDWVMETYNAKPGFELLVVDVEQTEIDVLNTFDINKWKPQMCIVEASEHHPTPGFNKYAPEINEYFERANYVKIYSDEINNIYIEGSLYASKQ